MSGWPTQYETPILIAQAHEAGQGTEAATTTTAAPGEAHGGEGTEPSQWLFFGFSMFAFLVIAIFAIAGTRRMRAIPRGLQNFLELAVESLYGIPEMVMGPRGRQYAPFLVTFFLYILVMNGLGLIPLFKAGTASLSITLGLAIVAFFYVQYAGFRAHGIRYLTHFLGPVPAMAFLILPLELLAELIRPVSLSVRLYGNLFGEEQVIEALSTKLSPFVAVLMLPLQLLTTVLQAFVFTLLVTVYISLATEKHEEEHGEAAKAPAH